MILLPVSLVRAGTCARLKQRNGQLVEIADVGLTLLST